MIGWIIRRHDPRLRFALLLLALLPALAWRIVWGAWHRPQALLTLNFYDRFFFIYYGFLMETAGDIERLKK